jgi:hypothetical protein
MPDTVADFANECGMNTRGSGAHTSKWTCAKGSHIGMQQNARMKIGPGPQLASE